MPDYEIDHGEPAPPQRTAPERPEIPAEEAAVDARLREALPGAVTRIRDAERSRHLVDMWSIALAGCCGQGLSGVLRTEPWTGGATIGVLAALAGLLAAGWMWRRARLVADALWALPIPLDDTVIERMAERDERQRAVERKRREEEIVRIEMFGGDLDMCLRRLRLATWGAAAGSVCGWLCAAFGPSGMMTLAASVAALPGAMLGWQVAAGGWPEVRVRRLLCFALPGAALVAALLGDTPVLAAVPGAVIAGAAAHIWRQRIAAFVATQCGGSDPDESGAA